MSIANLIVTDWRRCERTIPYKSVIHLKFEGDRVLVTWKAHDEYTITQSFNGLTWEDEKTTPEQAIDNAWERFQY